jgi:tRNA(Ile)-lysidine synthase
MGVAERLGLSLEFHQVEQILHLAGAPSAGKKEVLLHDGWKVVREAKELHFETKAADPKQRNDYEYSLAVPGELQVEETGTKFRTSVVKSARSNGTKGEAQLLKKGCLAAQLTVRNWRPGDHFWPAHSKGPKKVKELLQEQKISAASRQVWPVVVSGTELVWVRGFPVPANLAAEQNEAEAVLIEEISLRQEPYRGE